MYKDEDNALLCDLYSLLCHYTFFPIDDHTFAQYSQAEAYERHCAELRNLQRVAVKHFQEKLKLVALSNFAAIDTREDLQPLLEVLTDDELVELANLLLLRTTYPESLNFSVDRKFLMDVVVSTFERRKSFHEMTRDMNIMPTDQTLFESTQTRSDDYDGSRPLALPKLKLQYLSVGDFLWRSLVLYRCESFHGIRESILAALRRLRPEPGRTGGVHFPGASKMALPISKPT